MKGVDADVDDVATAQPEPGLGVRGGVHAIKFLAEWKWNLD